MATMMNIQVPFAKCIHKRVRIEDKKSQGINKTQTSPLIKMLPNLNFMMEYLVNVLHPMINHHLALIKNI